MESENEYPSSGDDSDDAVEKLAKGLLQLYQPQVVKVQNQLLELNRKQEALEAELHNENLILCEIQAAVEYQEMFRKIKIYREKLINIQKESVALYDRAAKMKKKAIKLEQQKRKEALEKVHQREQEEKMIGKASTD